LAFGHNLEDVIGTFNINPGDIRIIAICQDDQEVIIARPHSNGRTVHHPVNHCAAVRLDALQRLAGLLHQLNPSANERLIRYFISSHFLNLYKQ
jgi:hypothetical protein